MSNLASLVEPISSDTKELFRRMKDTGWVPLTLDNFANYGGSYQTTQYRKMFGMVHLRGMVVITGNSAPMSDPAPPPGASNFMAHDLPLAEKTTILQPIMINVVSAADTTVGSFYLFGNNSYLYWGSGGETGWSVSLDGISYAAKT